MSLLRYSQQNNVSSKAPTVLNDQGFVPLADRDGGRRRHPGNSLSQDRGSFAADEEVN